MRIGAWAGADLLSLDENTLPLAFDAGDPRADPVGPGDLDSLGRAIEAADKANISFIADPVLDPIHFGFARSIGRFIEARRRWPEVELLMGTGNLTELTDADSSGVTALLAGLCSELDIRNVLVVHVSPHTVRTVEEHDIARRILFAAKSDGALPRSYDPGLLQVHDRKPYAASVEDIATLAAEVRDANFRIMTAEDGIHVFNNKGHAVAQDAFELFAGLGVERDGAHAFYLGAELMKAEIAWRLGKRYAQDEPLAWRRAPAPETDDVPGWPKPATLRVKKEGSDALHSRDDHHHSRCERESPHRAARHHRREGRLIIAPFRPSVTLDNLAAVPPAVASYTDDVRIFAGCLTGRRIGRRAGRGLRCRDSLAALAHSVLRVEA